MVMTACKHNNANNLCNSRALWNPCRPSKPNNQHVARMPTERDAIEYNMNHSKRGKAIILNHERYDTHLALPPRNGTKVDEENLKNTLEMLHFDVVVYNDLCHSDIQKKMEIRE